MIARLLNLMRALVHLAGVMRQYRHLTWELTKREIRDRYAGQMLGLVWTVGHPLCLMGIYVIVFAFIFRIKIQANTGSSLDYTVYILSGLIPWLAFAETLAKNVLILVGNANLVKQVIFPIEVLPVKSVLTSVITQMIMTCLLFFYVLLRHGAVPWTYALIPILWMAQFCAMTGAGFLLAAFGAYFRDLKDFLQVFLIANLYLMPIFYMPAWMPTALKPIIYINPFSYFAWCYQDACYYGFIAHPWAWPVFCFGSVLLLAIGYSLFRKLKPHYSTVL